jgi:hypothetical protein
MKSYYLFFLLVLVSCKTTRPSLNSTQQTAVQIKESQLETGTEKAHAPNLLIYKTKSDYSNYVPVILSADKSQIVSYPAPSDVIKAGELQTPIALHCGYWLDRRGINKNVAFLNTTYADYSKLEQTPPIADLFGQIADKQPLLELFDSGSNMLNDALVSKINAWIDSGKLSAECKIINL